MKSDWSPRYYMTVSPAKILRPGYYTMEEESLLEGRVDENLLDKAHRDRRGKVQALPPKGKYTVYTFKRECRAALKALERKTKRKEKFSLLSLRDASNFPEREVLTLGVMT